MSTAKKRQALQVKEVSTLAGVSVRTLHHYDKIGLLTPSTRSSAGYRLYAPQDLFRLQQILIHRKLGFSLESIRACLDDSQFDRLESLRQQRQALMKQVRQSTQMLEAVNHALALLERKEMQTTDLKKLFDGFDPADYEQETKNRWGSSDTYKTSTKRTASYGEIEWKEIRVEQDSLYRSMAEAMNSGILPETEEAMDLAEAHRLFIDRWFYPCSKEHHACLADMYQADDRFRKNIDKSRDGLTDFLSIAIRENALR